MWRGRHQPDLRNGTLLSMMFDSWADVANGGILKPSRWISGMLDISSRQDRHDVFGASKLYWHLHLISSCCSLAPGAASTLQGLGDSLAFLHFFGKVSKDNPGKYKKHEKTWWPTSVCVRWCHFYDLLIQLGNAENNTSTTYWAALAVAHVSMTGLFGSVILKSCVRNSHWTDCWRSTPQRCVEFFLIHNDPWLRILIESWWLNFVCLMQIVNN